MKKIYTTPEYKRRNKRKSETKKRAGKEYIPLQFGGYFSTTIFRNDVLKPTVPAPNDLRLIENTEPCLDFFLNLRSREFLSQKKNIQFVTASLENVVQIDYGTISILTAIAEDLKSKKIVLKGDFPKDSHCCQFMVDSGFLDHVLDGQTNKPFANVKKSEMIFFEKGCGRLSEKENKKISQTVKNVVQHLTGELAQCFSVKTIILEICGNSIEWGGTENKQWLLGVKYEDGKVIFTVTDIGRGILDTLHKRFKLELADLFTMKSNDEILMGAFDKKYGSSTQEINRNKGLPAVKINFEQKMINNLKVLTNNVILHFDNPEQSRTTKRGYPRFKGTFYQWEMTKECLEKGLNK